MKKLALAVAAALVILLPIGVAGGATDGFAHSDSSHHIIDWD